MPTMQEWKGYIVLVHVLVYMCARHTKDFTTTQKNHQRLVGAGPEKTTRGIEVEVWKERKRFEYRGP